MLARGAAASQAGPGSLPTMSPCPDKQNTGIHVAALSPEIMPSGEKALWPRGTGARVVIRRKHPVRRRWQTGLCAGRGDAKIGKGKVVKNALRYTRPCRVAEAQMAGLALLTRSHSETPPARVSLRPREEAARSSPSLARGEPGGRTGGCGRAAGRLGIPRGASRGDSSHWPGRG